jgi:site-specific DNA-methyltransferase (cytosine-N4-specific)
VDYTLLEGDCRVKLASLPTAGAQCCITSPPYWHPAHDAAAVIGRQHAAEQYAEDLAVAFAEVRRLLCETGALWLILGDDPRAIPGTPRRVASRLQADGWILERELIWEESGSGFQQSVFLFAKSTLGNAPAQAESPWRFPAEAAREDYGWSTLPVPLASRCIEASTSPGDLVLDPFCGLASAGVAALQLGRRFLGIDTDRRALQLAWSRLRNAGPCTEGPPARRVADP